MKKLPITIAILILCINLSVHAQGQGQPQRKPNFTFDQKTMIELGLSAEQQQKINEIKTRFGVEFNKLAMEGKEYAATGEKKMDSVLNDAQKQKASVMKEAVKAENKANPSLRKSFVYDQKTMDELGLSPEQQKKMTLLRNTDQVGRWQYAQKMTKMGTQVTLDQEALLTDAQKQKVTEIKTSIAEYNKNIK